MTDFYIIKDGDTIESIAYMFNTSPRILDMLNYNKEFVVGEKIIVPRVNNFDFLEVKNGDTLYNIAKNYGINSELLAQLNGINIDDYIYPNQILLVPKSGTKLYFTTNGDTLTEVASGLNANVMELIKQNNRLYLQPEQLIIFRYR